mmetsp:Transcript_35523/g.62680  ORF Transcript_35523/g.62680 Transcript_35523/m.62680 type:complete len:215 (-) Transcript_35523:368-1012(-)
MALSSSPCADLNLSNSSAFFLQSVSRSATNCLSVASPSSVSSRSCEASASFTASSPCRTVFASIAFVIAAISFFFASTKFSYDATRSASCTFNSSSSFCISSRICFIMPTISALCGVFSSPPRKEVNSSRSPISMSTVLDNRRSNDAVFVWRKEADKPFSIAGIALLRASMSEVIWADSLLNWDSCFSRSAVDIEMAFWASSRLDLASARCELS